ncbi:acyltransferase [Vibrio cholerae]|uniref:WblB protein n=1 Tax=Vibrio cholerae TaxID=666 RepID=O87158_VIBCL|nr:acyltransferase [Vibrio cholerae]EGR4117273.1 acyltransferase [Vibrio cholerae]EJL6604780.1 acyltransferase [Vibrio cholerae]EJL6622993.1 acyltransferase [Vibrio cholerae]EJL6823655.1 acyltransferase [Vibrio cholerae]EKF9418440.1 acyltransferase [Vibrio cholerae]
MIIVKKMFLKVHNLQYCFFKIKSYYYRAIFMSCGDGLVFWGKCNIKNPQNIILGNDVSINDGAYINGLGGITIGNNVSISAGSMIISTTLDPNSLIFKKHVNKPIKIGNHVQVGAGAIILPGVEVGDNVMIGAGAVVTKNIVNNCIVVGNPARVLRKIEML